MRLFSNLNISRILCAALFCSFTLSFGSLRNPTYQASIKIKPGMMDRVNVLIDQLIQSKNRPAAEIYRITIAIKKELEVSTGIAFDLNVCMAMVDKEL